MSDEMAKRTTDGVARLQEVLKKYAGGLSEEDRGVLREFRFKSAVEEPDEFRELCTRAAEKLGHYYEVERIVEKVNRHLAKCHFRKADEVLERVKELWGEEAEQYLLRQPILPE